MLFIPDRSLKKMLRTKTIREISEFYGIDYFKLYHQIRKMGLKTSAVGKVSKKRLDLDDRKMAKLYNMGWSLEMISSYYDVCRDTVKRRIEGRVKHIRNRSETMKIRLKDLTEEERKERTLLANKIRQARSYLRMIKNN